MKRLALVMIVRDEERCLARCLESAKPYVDEIVVCDTGSEDLTIPIAERYGARIVRYPWDRNFANARNFALSHSEADWNLVLDADEYITDFVMDELVRFMESDGPATVGTIEIRSETEEDCEIAIASSFVPRLLPSGARYQGRIHEQVDSTYRRHRVPIIAYHDGYLNRDKSGRNIPLLLQTLQDHVDDPYYTYQLAKEYKGAGRLDDACEQFDRSYRHLTGRESYAPQVVTGYLYSLMACKRLGQAMHIVSSNHPWLSRSADYFFACGIFYLEYALSYPTLALEIFPLIEASYERCLVIGESTERDAVRGTGSYAALYNLGVFYEVQGQTEAARRCYRQAIDLGYEKAKIRLLQLQ